MHRPPDRAEEIAPAHGVGLMWEQQLAGREERPKHREDRRRCHRQPNEKRSLAAARKRQEAEDAGGHSEQQRYGHVLAASGAESPRTHILPNSVL